jgi:hypothetical protein
MSWNPVNRQKMMAEQMRIKREEALKKQAELIAANPKPPVFPSGPMPDTSKGIGFGTRRNVVSLGKGRKRKSKSKKTARRSRK